MGNDAKALLEITLKKSNKKKIVTLKYKRNLFSKTCVVEECGKIRNNCTSELLSQQMRRDFDRCTFSGTFSYEPHAKVNYLNCSQSPTLTIVSDKVRYFFLGNITLAAYGNNRLRWLNSFLNGDVISCPY